MDSIGLCNDIHPSGILPGLLDDTEKSMVHLDSGRGIDPSEHKYGRTRI